MFSKNRVVSILGECLGTAALTLVALAVTRASQLPVTFFIATSLGIALTILIFAFNRNQNGGAHLNPAITLGMWTIRRIGTIDAVLYIAFQIFGAFLAYLLFTYMVNTTIQNSVLNFTGRVMVAEAVGTFVLAFAWAAALYRGYKGLALSASVGLAYVVGIFITSAAVQTGGILNPAVALGNHQWQWGTTVLGPVLGALVGFNLYALLFAHKDEVVIAAAETAIVSEKPAMAEMPIEQKPARTIKKVATAKKTTSRSKRAAKK